MNPKNNKKLKIWICVICVALLSMGGYYYLSLQVEKQQEDIWADFGLLKIGSDLTVYNKDNRLSLLEIKDVLSADGLYYASWTMGEPETGGSGNEGNTGLRDTRIYLVVGEHKSSEEAGADMAKWLDAAREKYEVLTEEEISCDGQAYSLITYHWTDEEETGGRGMSAFGVHDSTAVCIELICGESFAEDPEAVLIPFLENCVYGGE